MGKRIACICGKPGRVQHTRMKFLRDNYLPYLDVYAGDVPDLSKYEVVYFSHYSLAKKVKFDGKRKMLASVTSHKYDKKELGKFDRISVNNRILLNELAEFNPVLTENGVDTKFWTPGGGLPEKAIVGWVGNVDRKAKRYHWVNMLRDGLGFVDVRTVETSKHSKVQPNTPEEMRDFYREIAVLVVTSESEGTPNPALEAMSCGTPVVSMRVGNMPQTGAILVSTPLEMCYSIGRVTALCQFISQDVRKSMVEDWDWSIKYKAWDNFFKEWL